jgi:hypothetical protein
VRDEIDGNFDEVVDEESDATVKKTEGQLVVKAPEKLKKSCYVLNRLQSQRVGLLSHPSC